MTTQQITLPREVVEAALEALENCAQAYDEHWVRGMPILGPETDAASNELRAALQPQPTPPVGQTAAEPVAINYDPLFKYAAWNRLSYNQLCAVVREAVSYTTPQPAPDTAEAMRLALDTLRGLLCGLTGDEYADAKAAIAALEKVVKP